MTLGVDVAAADGRYRRRAGVGDGATLYGDATAERLGDHGLLRVRDNHFLRLADVRQSVGSGSTPQSVTAGFSNLQPNTTYHYRLDATNGDRHEHGIDRVVHDAANADLR